MTFSKTLAYVKYNGAVGLSNFQLQSQMAQLGVLLSSSDHVSLLS